MIGVAFIGAFVAGVLSGVMFREAYELLRGRDDPMDLWHRLRHVQTPTLAVGLIVAMVLQGVIGVALMLSNSARGDLVRCVSDYNTQVGQARDSRAAAQARAAVAERAYVAEDLRYQRRLLTTLSGDVESATLVGIVSTRLEASRAYQAELDDLAVVRAEQPYPAPDLCEGQ